MAASILFNNKVTLRNVPFVKDVHTMKDLLISLEQRLCFQKKKMMTITNKKT